MDLPSYEFLPGPVWLLTLLHLVTLTVHFLAMNFLVGGVVAVLFGRFEDRWRDPTVKAFLDLFPAAMAATVTFGVAPLLFLQVIYHRQVYAASIVSGWFWLMIPLAAIFSYYFLYAAAFSKAEGAGRKGICLALALLGLITISLVYSSIFSMAENPDLVASLYAANQSGFALNTEVGSWIFRWLHMVLGALTVGGFFVGLLGRDNPPAFSVGKTFYLYGMAAAALFGFIYMFTFGDVLAPFMRHPASWFLWVSVILSGVSVHFFFKRKFVVSGTMLLVSMAGMVVARHTVRLLRLGDRLEVAEVPVRSQWDVFGLFLVCFLAAIGLIAYMIYLLVRGRGEQAA